MKIIDLLQRIANKEEVPKKIKYDNHIFEYKKGINRNLEYICIDATDNIWKELNIDDAIDEIYKIPLILNDEIEIIEDTPKEDRCINVCGSLFTKSEYDELAKSKEDNKINRVERKARNLTNQYIKEKLNEIIDRLNGEDNE